jgi:NHLM bacteriocin system ABC transporter ATP-binding protein
VTAASPDPLLEACRLVAEAQGIAVRPCAVEPGHDRLQAIARASAFRLREVLLPDRWWRQDSPPFLAHLRDGNRPVAVLPGVRGGYRLIDPNTGTERAVNGQLAASLEPAAFVFYRPLPARPLKLRDLVTFGFRGARGDVAMVVLAGITSGLLALVAPLGIALLLGVAAPAGDRAAVFELAGIVAAAALATTALELTGSFAVLRIRARLDAAVQPALWDRLLDLPVPFFRGFAVGDLAGRILGVYAVKQLFTTSLLQTFLRLIFALFSLALLFFYSVRLASAAISTVAAAAALMAMASRVHLRRQRILQAAQHRLSDKALQLVMGVSKFRVAGAEKQAFSIWEESFLAQRRAAVATARTANGVAMLLSVLAAACYIPVLAVAALDRPLLTPIAFLGFNAAFIQFVSSISMISIALTSLPAVLPVLENLKPVLEAQPEAVSGARAPGTLTGGVEIDNVSFRYDQYGPLVLDSVSIRAKAGECIAIVGPSGSGKSTLVRLLLGFERPCTGSVRYDGHDLSGLDAWAVRRQLGTVLQHGSLIGGDVFTNIVGVSRLQLADAWEAARIAAVDETIRSLPMGMHTAVTDGARTFSGGQRQQLLIARAVASKPRILLLDEATSSVDNRAEELVDTNLRGLGSTRIIIAHRLSTVQHADRIYVLAGGRVVQSGTYGELLMHSEVFAEMAGRQLA